MREYQKVNQKRLKKEKFIKELENSLRELQETSSARKARKNFRDNTNCISKKF